MKIRITKEQAEAVVKEIARRHKNDLIEEEICKYVDSDALLREKKQGMYGSLMAISSNWPDVVWWLKEYEEKYDLVTKEERKLEENLHNEEY